ncbi:MAG: hypothetical protein IKD62_02385 [Oscillospiraceae bacterium]|nr:hypothetical protein [Oscillospiraceae bacterium]
MMFTYGEDAFFERLMKQKPNFDKKEDLKHRKKNSAGWKQRYASGQGQRGQKDAR